MATKTELIDNLTAVSARLKEAEKRDAEMMSVAELIDVAMRRSTQVYHALSDFAAQVEQAGIEFNHATPSEDSLALLKKLEDSGLIEV